MIEKLKGIPEVSKSIEIDPPKETEFNFEYFFQRRCQIPPTDQFIPVVALSIDFKNSTRESIFFLV